MLADCHMHTCFSEDSDSPVETMIDQAIRLGMRRICITDHYDMDFPKGEFQLDTEAYRKRIEELRERYRGRLEIGLGVELGLQPHLAGRIQAYVRRYPYDFVIGSVHLLEGKDPYNRQDFDLSDQELYEKYFACTLENIRSTEGFHTLGHLDYVVRYGYSREREYSYNKYAEWIDPILQELIHKGIALEVNSGGLKYGLGFPNPHPDILRRYRQLGGEMVTVGSDAHRPEQVGYGFDTLPGLLWEAGFGYVTLFREGKPEFVKI